MANYQLQVTRFGSADRADEHETLTVDEYDIKNELHETPATVELEEITMQLYSTVGSKAIYITKDTLDKDSEQCFFDESSEEKNAEITFHFGCALENGETESISVTKKTGFSY